MQHITQLLTMLLKYPLGRDTNLIEVSQCSELKNVFVPLNNMIVSLNFSIRLPKCNPFAEK